MKRKEYKYATHGSRANSGDFASPLRNPEGAFRNVTETDRPSHPNVSHIAEITRVHEDVSIPNAPAT